MVIVHLLGAGEHPGHSLDLVLGDAAPFQVAAAEEEGAARVKLFGGFAKPAGGEGVIGRIGFLSVVLQADVTLGSGHAVLRGDQGPAAGFLEIDGDAIAPEIADAQRVFGVHMALPGGLEIPLESLFHIRCHAVADAQGLGQGILRFGIALFRRTTAPLNGLGRIRFGADSLIQQERKMVLGFGVPFLRASLGLDEILQLRGDLGGIAGEGGLIRTFAGELTGSLLRLLLLFRREGVVVFLEHLGLELIGDVEEDQTPGHRFHRVRRRAEAFLVDERHDVGGAIVTGHGSVADPVGHGLEPFLILRVDDLLGEVGPGPMMAVFRGAQQPFAGLREVGLDVLVVLIEHVQGVFGVALVLIGRLAQPDDPGGHVLLDADAVEKIAAVAGLAESVALFGAELMQPGRLRLIAHRADPDEVVVRQSEEFFGIASGRLELGLREGCFGAELGLPLDRGLSSSGDLAGRTGRRRLREEDGQIREQAGQAEGGGGDDEGADVGTHG